MVAIKKLSLSRTNKYKCSNNNSNNNNKKLKTLLYTNRKLMTMSTIQRMMKKAKIKGNQGNNNYREEIKMAE